MISDTLSAAAAEIRAYLKHHPKVYEDVAPLINDLLMKMDTLRALLDMPPSEPSLQKPDSGAGKLE